MKGNNKMGIRQQIEKAKTEKEVQTLLAKGNMYANISEKTKRKCERTAAKRITELNKA
jgi:hypothetical protein